MNWHVIGIDKVLEELQSRPEGLPATEAASRLQQHGPNELQEKKKRPVWMMFLLQFKDFMILILLAAAIVSAVVGDLKDMIVIMVIVIINAVVGFLQEYRAEKAIDALKKMAATNARVKRDETIHKVPAAELVPGDIVLMEAGDMVPADLRIIKSYGLKIEEASLTGESNAIEKITDPVKDEKVPLGDRVNMTYKSTLVTYGRGEGVVVATGMKTEIGRIAQMLQEEESLTPLQKRLSDFSKKLSFIVIGICALLYGIGLLRGEDPVTMLLTAISLAVAAIPEALPAVVTIALARGANKMVSNNALIRKLPAVETLGSVTFICTDKTGTLTQNRMTVQDIWVQEQQDSGIDSFTPVQLLMLSMTLNQDTKKNNDNKIVGDPTEIALVEYAMNHEAHNAEWQNKYPREHEVPFDSDRKLMTTVHKMENGYLVITKGAYESIVDKTTNLQADIVNPETDKMAASGQRVIAYACKKIDSLPSGIKPGDLESNLHFTGLAGMIDPPRQEAKQAVQECKTAGIVPVMITGDHPLTAKAIANEIGFLFQEGDKVVTGPDLEALSPENFKNDITHIKVYARVSPEQKLRIVKTLQEKNEFVAMTGDGVNDAPALKRANIGVAMGITGTDVSKEAAHMILLDDNFATIVKAVKEGRRIFDNIRRFIRYVLTCNFAEILTIFIAPLVGLPIPLLPIHILWINLVTDGLPGLALASEPAEKNIMQRPPRLPSESIFAKGLGVHVIWVGMLMAALTLGVQAWAIYVDDAHWQTMVFNVLCFCQLAHVMAIRSESVSLFRQGIFSNLPLLGTVLLTFGLQLIVTYVPALSKIFSIEPLTTQELLICIGVSLIILVAVEIEKIIRNRHRS
jgi:P-type Ca2+ transporter type 2C